MEKLKFNSIKDFFNEIDNNYEKKYNEDKNNKNYCDKLGFLNNNWYYTKDLLKTAINNYLDSLKIKQKGKGYKIWYGLNNRAPKPENSLEDIYLAVLPTKHTINSGVYLLINRNKENKKTINYRFTYSDKDKPPKQIIEMMDSFSSKHDTSLNISDNALDDIAKDKINKFIELSKENDFPSMKNKRGKGWNPEYKTRKQGSENNKCDAVINTINTPSNFILYGPPGTGKTYKTVDISAGIIGGGNDKIDTVEKIIDIDKIDGIDEKEFHKNNTKVFNAGLKEGKIHFVTFHQNYSYEEFVGGLRPDEDNEDKLRFQWKPGIFIKACAKALELATINKPNEKEQKDLEKWFLDKCTQIEHTDFQDSNKYDFKSEKVVLIIDEINRANISRVFGELITLIEGDKRIAGRHQLILTLPNGDKKFGVPANLIIMGTMNTADKSLALLDVALRRRFEFIGLFPKPKLAGYHGELLKKLNKKILDNRKSPNLLIGHSYFMDKKDDLEIIFNNNVIPLLNEYFMGNRENVEKLLKGIVKTEVDDNGVLKCIGEHTEKIPEDNGRKDQASKS